MAKASLAAVGAALCLLAALGAGRADEPTPAPERHEGYYYPVPQSSETYHSAAQLMSDTTRIRRLAFVTGMSEKMFKNPYPPPFAIFAKGDQAERLIIVSLYDGSYNTVFRARALLAMLTAVARLSPVFTYAKVDELSTFLDLCKMLGFTSVVWSDGREAAHRINIE
jgi:hypothetical protein